MFFREKYIPTEIIINNGLVSVVIIAGSMDDVSSAEISSALAKMEEVHHNIKNFRILSLS